MVTAGYLVEIIFGVASLVPPGRYANVEMAQVSWNYTTFLNIAFLAGAAVLVVRFVRTGGTGMLTRMGGTDDMAGHTYGRHDGHGGHGQGGHDEAGSIPDHRAGHLAAGASHDHHPRR